MTMKQTECKHKYGGEQQIVGTYMYIFPRTINKKKALRDIEKTKMTKEEIERDACIE